MDDELIKNIKNDKFAKQTGIRLEEVQKGHAVAIVEAPVSEA